MAMEKLTGMVKVATVELQSESCLFTISAYDTNLLDRPDHFIVLDKIVNGVVKNLNIQNWPVHCFDVTGCTGLTISGLNLDNSAGNVSRTVALT